MNWFAPIIIDHSKKKEDGRKTPKGYNKVYRGDAYLFSFSITPKGYNAVNNIQKDFERYAGIVLCD